MTAAAATTDTSGTRKEVLANAVGGKELRMVKLDDIIVPPERHKRRGRRHQGQLEGSMKEKGLDTPILVSAPDANGKFRLVAGGGRLENARTMGWSEIHAIVQERDAKAEAASTAAENMAREALSPAEEADALEHMIRAGYGPREAAGKVGLTQHTGTLRMPLVEVPESVRCAFHHDGLPPSLASLLKTLYDGNHQIAEAIAALALKLPEEVTVALKRGPGEMFRTMPYLHREAKLGGKTPFIASLRRGSGYGRGLAWDAKDPDRIRLKGKAARWFMQQVSGAASWQRSEILFSEEDLDAAVAVGVAYHEEGELGHVWVHDRKWLTDHVNDIVLPRMQVESEARASEKSGASASKARAGRPADIASMSVADLAPTLERRFHRELKPKAHEANLDLGSALATKLEVKNLTRDHALFFAYEVLGRGDGWDRGPRRLAECAARVMPGWITVEKRPLKSGKIKETVIYLEGEAAEKRMWEYVKGASTPEDVLQRALHIYAAAASFRRECGANGKTPHNQQPENATAQAALRRLAKPVIPASVRRIDRQIREYDAREEAERAIQRAKNEVEPARQTVATQAHRTGSRRS